MSGYMQGNQDGAVTVPFSDDDIEKKDDDLPEDPPAGASPQQLSEHKRKKGERTKRMLEEGKQALQKVKELEERDAARARELAELRGYVAAQAQQPRATREPAEDPYQAKLDDIASRRANAEAALRAELAAGKMDEKRAKYYEDLGNQLDAERIQTHVAREMAKTKAVEAVRKPQEEAQQYYRSKYPDVYRDQRAYAYAEAEWKKRTQALGQAASEELLDEVMNEARTHFKLGPKPQATATERARMSGIPSSGNGGGAPSSANGINFSNAKIRNMALAAYDHLPEAEALKAWTQKTGRRLREKKIL